MGVVLVLMRFLRVEKRGCDSNFVGVGQSASASSFSPALPLLKVLKDNPYTPKP